MSELLKARRNYIVPLKKGQAFAIFIAFTLFIYAIYFAQTTAFASKKNGLATVYHVYVDEQHIGKVEDRSIVEKIIEAKLQKDDAEDVTYVIDENITYVAEKSFNPTYHNDRVSKRLDNMLTVKAEAYELKIGDEILGYFSDDEIASQVIAQYQMTFLQEDDIEQYQSQLQEQMKEERTPISEDVINIDEVFLQENQPDLSVGDTQLIDVSLGDDVEIIEQRVEPNEIIDLEVGLTLLEKGTLEDEKHQVAEGDVLGSIAKQYDLTTKELLDLNPSITEDTLLQIDQQLNVTAFKPFVDVVVIEEEMVEEKIAFETEIVESDKMYKGEEKVKQKGKNGKKEVHYQVEKTNGAVTDREVLDQEIIKKPTKKIVIKGTKVIPSRGSGVLTWPTNGGYVSSNYGYRWGRLHKGIDIARPSNRTIKAADHGVVAFAGWQGGYGNKIIINHNNGMKTVYAHLSSINVRTGQTIEKGSSIGIMGSTGHSTGIHLHFEVHQNGSIQNPLKFY